MPRSAVFDLVLVDRDDACFDPFPFCLSRTFIDVLAVDSSLDSYDANERAGLKVFVRSFDFLFSFKSRLSTQLAQIDFGFRPRHLIAPVEVTLVRKELQGEPKT